MEVGRGVVISGLQQRSDLNGEFGKLLSYDAAVDRWAVSVGDENLRIRTANLSLHGDIVLMPPEEVDMMGSLHLESRGPVILTSSTDRRPDGEIVKFVQDADGRRFKLPWADLKAYLSNVDVGSTKKEVEASLKQGIYVGLNIKYFASEDECRPEAPLCCVFVGDEWVDERRRMQDDNNAFIVSLTFDAGAAGAVAHCKLPKDRMFDMGPYRMTHKTLPLVSYFAFVKQGKNNCEAHLLPMVLTDTHYACNAVAIYAKIFLA